MSKKEGTIKQKSLWQEIWKNKAIYLIMLPGIVWFIIFAYGGRHEKKITRTIERSSWRHCIYDDPKIFARRE